MKSFKKQLNLSEALNYGFYRDNFGDIDRSDIAETYLMEFWKILGEYCTKHGGFISRNNYRIYIPIPRKWVDLKPMRVNYRGKGDGSSQILISYEQDLEFSLEDAKILSDTLKYKNKNIKSNIERAIRNHDDDTLYNIGQMNMVEDICDYIEHGLRNKGIMKASADLTGNLLTYEGSDGRERRIKITKLLSGNILDAYNMLLTFISTPKDDILLCFSNHKYDIAGKSTDRKWVSCMELYGGNTTNMDRELALSRIIGDIRNGAFVSYIISGNDTNIEDPFGRIAIVPTKDSNNNIIYVPEKTVYTPFVGLENVYDFVLNIMRDIYDTPGFLSRIAGVFADTYNKGKDTRGFIINTRGSYKGYNMNTLALPMPTKRSQVDYNKLFNDLTTNNFNIHGYEGYDLKNLCKSVFFAIMLGAIYYYWAPPGEDLADPMSRDRYAVIPCGKKDFYKKFSNSFRYFDKYQYKIEEFIQEFGLENMWKFDSTRDADEYTVKLLKSKGFLMDYDSSIDGYWVVSNGLRPMIMNLMMYELKDIDAMEGERATAEEKKIFDKEKYLVEKLRSKYKEIDLGDIALSIRMLASGEVEGDVGKTYAISEENFPKVFGYYDSSMMEKFLQDYKRLGGTVKYETNREAQQATGYPTSV